MTTPREVPEEKTMIDDEETKKARQFFMASCAPVFEKIARKHGLETARLMLKSAAIKAGLNPDDFDVFRVGAS